MHGTLLPAWLHAAKVRANKGTRKIVSDNNGVFVVKFIIILSLYYYLWEDKVADKDVIGKILYTDKEIQKKAKELGKQITKDYRGEELILLGTLKGAILWMSELMKNIALDVKIDFISASSYGSGTTSSGIVKIKKDISMDIYNKHVLIVEDIVDTGTTLKFLKDYLEDRNPKSVKVCTMLDKPSRRKNDIVAEYTGFSVEDLFVIGYGLDYDQKYRNLPYISYLESEDIT